MQNNFKLFREAERSNDPLTQLRICETILHRDSNHLPALELKAKSLWRDSKFQEAAQTISKAISLNPHEPGYYFLRGDCLQHLARYGEALREFEKCRECKDTQLAAQSETRVKALEEFQEVIIAELMNSNPEFREQYRDHPAEALQAYGFAFAEKRPDQVAVESRARPELWARPS